MHATVANAHAALEPPRTLALSVMHSGVAVFYEWSERIVIVAWRTITLLTNSIEVHYTAG